MIEISKQAQILLLAIHGLRGIDQAPGNTVTEGFATILREFRDVHGLQGPMHELWDQGLYGILDDEAPHYIEGLTSSGRRLASELHTAESFRVLSDLPRSIRIDSANWTGRFQLSISQKMQITGILTEIRSIVEIVEFSNSQRANALALIEAAERLAETSDPQWPEIVMLLKSPILASITGIAGLVLSIGQILLSAMKP
ncbi:MAG: hypothetical protein QOI38_1704 [Sphingomonadales bacterium]|jgi:hypothetical protein|nr:hypothetical protein [Sphingomonadales bacterium]